MHRWIKTSLPYRQNKCICSWLKISHITNPSFIQHCRKNRRAGIWECEILQLLPGPACIFHRHCQQGHHAVWNSCCTHLLVLSLCWWEETTHKREQFLFCTVALFCSKVHVVYKITGKLNQAYKINAGVQMTHHYSSASVVLWWCHQNSCTVYLVLLQFSSKWTYIKSWYVPIKP